MPELNELKERILELNDAEALRAAQYVATWMQQQLPAEWQAGVDDDQAADLLAQAFPDLSGPLEQTRSGASQASRGAVARNMLLVLAQEPDYAGKVDEAIDQLAYKFDPITMMAAASLIVFVLSLKFHASYNKRDGFKFEVSKEASAKETIHKVLSFGVGGSAAKSEA